MDEEKYRVVRNDGMFYMPAIQTDRETILRFARNLNECYKDYSYKAVRVDEQGREVPVDLYQQEMRRALDDEHQARSNVNRLRDRVHEIAADRDRIKAENEKLRQLVRDMWHDGMCDCDEFRVCAQGEYHCAECEYGYHERMRELGIEV